MREGGEKILLGNYYDWENFNILNVVYVDLYYVCMVRFEVGSDK